MEEEGAAVHLDRPGQKAPEVIDIPERDRLMRCKMTHVVYRATVVKGFLHDQITSIRKEKVHKRMRKH